jgi:hypothetical protein
MTSCPHDTRPADGAGELLVLLLDTQLLGGCAVPADVILQQARPQAMPNALIAPKH